MILKLVDMMGEIVSTPFYEPFKLLTEHSIFNYLGPYPKRWAVVCVRYYDTILILYVSLGIGILIDSDLFLPYWYRIL